MLHRAVRIKSMLFKINFLLVILLDFELIIQDAQLSNFRLLDNFTQSRKVIPIVTAELVS